MNRSFLLFCLGLLCAGAQAQPINAAWEGQWVVIETSQGTPGAGLRIARAGGATQLTRGGKTCTLAYDGTVTPASVSQHLRALQAHQLDPQHWPAGTDTAQLVGLAREFTRAQVVIDTVQPGDYRKVRAVGPGCDGDPAFMLLHKGQDLVRVVFSTQSLGADVSLLRRQQ